MRLEESQNPSVQVVCRRPIEPVCHAFVPEQGHVLALLPKRQVELHRRQNERGIIPVPHRQEEGRLDPLGPEHE